MEGVKVARVALGGGGGVCGGNSLQYNAVLNSSALRAASQPPRNPPRTAAYLPTRSNTSYPAHCDSCAALWSRPRYGLHFTQTRRRLPPRRHRLDKPVHERARPISSRSPLGDIAVRRCAPPPATGKWPGYSCVTSWPCGSRTWPDSPNSCQFTTRPPMDGCAASAPPRTSPTHALALDSTTY